MGWKERTRDYPQQGAMVWWVRQDEAEARIKRAVEQIRRMCWHQEGCDECTEKECFAWGRS